MATEDRSCMSVMITSTDMLRTVKFYTAVLGFELKESWPSADEPMWANLVLDGQSVMAGMPPQLDMIDKMCPDPVEAKYWRGAAQAFADNKPGVGVQIYIMVPDIDAYAKEIRTRGAEFHGEPKTQFYGIREIAVHDPDGYRLVLFSPIQMTSCQSCGMPLSNAAAGQMYCDYCTDAGGNLKSYEEVFEGTVTGFFMGMQKMERKAAEAAAKEHLAQMPAWTKCQ